MSQPENRIRTTHAGSLPRPPHLRKLLAAGFAGQGAGQGAGEEVAAAELAEASAAAARALGDPSRILAGTDCGFETSSGVSFVAEVMAWAKLASLCEGAEIASRKLLG